MTFKVDLGEIDTWIEIWVVPASSWRRHVSLAEHISKAEFMMARMAMGRLREGKAKRQGGQEKALELHSKWSMIGFLIWLC